MQQSNFEDVGEFHHKFGLPSVTHQVPGAGPRDVDDDLLLFRLKFMLEELLEFANATGHVLHQDQETGAFLFEKMANNYRDHAEMFDALIDLNYVALGTAHLFGYPWQNGWDEVQKANMAKERATDETASLRGGTWDVVKPEGWTPPDIDNLLRDFGWDF